MAESSRQAPAELTFRRNMPVEKQWKAIDQAQPLLQAQRNIQLAARDEARAMKAKAGRAWANPGEKLNSDSANKDEADIQNESPPKKLKEDAMNEYEFCSASGSPFIFMCETQHNFGVLRRVSYSCETT